MTQIKKTLIEDGTELKGTINSSCPIVVMGRVEGEMIGPSVEVTESGVLCGKAKVTELRSRGELAGEFDADVVELSGKVRDRTTVRARSLEVSLQRGDGRIEMVFGDCELAVGDAPDKAKAVREATAAGHGRAAASAAPLAAADAAPTVALAVPPSGRVREEPGMQAESSSVSGRNGLRAKKPAEPEPQAETV
jgi:cytoskeletal protein CcmA (bactofilin family)